MLLIILLSITALCISACMVDLSMFDDQYEQAKPLEHSGGDEVPDGKYQATLEVFELTTTKSSNQPMLKFQLRVLAGEHATRCVFKNSVISAAGLDYIKKDLSLLGFNGKLSEMEQPEARMALIGKSVEIMVKTKGEDAQGRPNRNVYINKALNLEPSQVAGALVAAKVAKADEPPF